MHVAERASTPVENRTTAVVKDELGFLNRLKLGGYDGFNKQNMHKK
jgi:hypothetical protein